MKGQSWTKKISTLLLVTLLVVITGCQALGGFDVNKALVEAVVAQSMEGEGEFSLNLVIDEKASISPEQLAMLKLFENTKVNFDSIKMENNTRMSVKGSILIAKYDIPFEASVNEEQFVLKIDGGKKPIVIGTKVDSSSEETVPAFFTELQTKLSDGELNRSITSYFIKQLPNPSKFNVETVSEIINGETVSLHKLHSEITGKELLPLVKAFVKNVLKDDQALKELVGQLYDALYPLIAAELDKAVAAIPDESMDMYADEHEASDFENDEYYDEHEASDFENDEYYDENEDYDYEDYDYYEE
ncbi:MAG: copper amine oxidase N-terminal protein, partial [Paenibacillus sp.]|nr:copper amine oxidase N-terminal protein [Paenibacillus sp.]